MKIRRLCCVAAVSCLVFVLPQALIADPLDNWHLRYTVTLSHNLGMHLFYGGGFFVATGANGQIATSPDGVTWTERVSGVTADLSAGAYGNGTFVIFGDGGLVLTSPDGVNWTPKYLDPTIIGNAVIYANGLFACACNDGRIVTSPDGFSWAVKNTGAPSFLSGITYGNGLFVAVGQFATVVTSSDGVTWTANTLPIPSEPIFGIAYGNDLFVAVGAHDFGGVLLSSDGLNWTPMWGLFNINLGSIAYGDGTFVADRGEGSAAILSSQDGKSWTLIHQGHPWLDYSPVIFGNHTFMVGTNPYGDIYQSDPINQPPVALCQNVTVNAGSACTAPASIDKGSYEPNGDPVTLTQAPAGPYPLGTTTPVTLTVTDSKPPSSQSQCAGTVTVQDKTPPTITMASVSPSVLWPPNHKMVDVTVNYTSIDNCSSQPTCTISGVTSNEPISSSDYSIVDPHHVKLSADRLGSGNGRIYTISIACTDASGNPSTQTVAVSVPHDQGKN